MAKKGPFVVKIEPESVMHTSISNTKNGYNSARMVAKVNDNEFLSISYEWEGESIPGFAMDLMGFIQAAELKLGTVAGKEAAFEEYSKKCGSGGGKKKSMPDPDMMTDDEKKKKSKEKK